MKTSLIDKITPFKTWYTIVLAGILGSILAAFALYYLSDFLFRVYINGSAKRIISLEKKGLLSREYGYVWSEINLNKEMHRVKRRMTGNDTVIWSDSLVNSRNVREDIPSISAIKELNTLQQLSKVISITDRNNYPLAEIRTTQNLIRLAELNPFLLEALLFTEDKNWRSRKCAYESKALIRAVIYATFQSLKNFKPVAPRGTSTIHQQVARFLLLKFNKKGYTYTDKSVSRKIKEIKIAQALMLNYSKEEILEVYINHCVSAGRGMVGFYDISMGLFNCPPNELDTCRSLYLARLVKWNSHVPRKISSRIKSNLSRLADHFHWTKEKMVSIGEALDTLTFNKPRKIITDHSHLIDCANVNWLKLCENSGMNGVELHKMDIANPESMIRRKGHLRIQLHIDIRLQRLLEEEVNARGYGNDTTIITDVRIGSYGHDVIMTKSPNDSLRVVSILSKDSLFSEPNSSFTTPLNTGDTLITNIRYTEKGKGIYKRSLYFYKRDSIQIPGQYYSYAIINAKTGELLAYFSKDGLGSNLNSLLRNRVPNGSAIAKPVIFALNYDLGNYNSITMMTDREEVSDSLPWARSFNIDTIRTDPVDTVGMIYHRTSQKGGYEVHNHHKSFDGYDYAFNHLARSNNIITVEGIYRLNCLLFNSNGVLTEKGKPVVAMLSRLQLQESFSPQTGRRRITGPRLYSVIAGCTGARVDSIWEGKRNIPMPHDNYSIALGTLELSLYEQMHLFNMFYQNRLISNPADHPSLVIKSAIIAGENLEFTDSIPYYTPFSDANNLKPVKLGMHKRLISDPTDQLTGYDIYYSSLSESKDLKKTTNLLSNYAKSGTTDDIILPYNNEPGTKARTNYGLWNATLRIKLTRDGFFSLLTDSLLPGNINPEEYVSELPGNEIMDITLACIGECNFENTGVRDGKTLHKFISKRILHEYGMPCKEGFYRRYERYLHSITPDSIRFKDLLEKEILSSSKLSKILSKTKKKKLAALDELRFVKKFIFGLWLEKKSYFKLLSYAPYLGIHADQYLTIIEKLKKSKNVPKARNYLEELKNLEIDKPRLKRDIDKAVEVLINNLEKFENR